MLKLKRVLVVFCRDQNGATAIEYGLLAALIGVGTIAAFGAFGGGLSNLFDATSDKAGNAFINAGASF